MPKKKESVERTYLKSVHLKGYKSIVDVEIDLHKELNIIIGKNAAGKTNFLEFLSKVLWNDFDSFASFEANFILNEDFKFFYRAEIDIKKPLSRKKNMSESVKLFIKKRDKFKEIGEGDSDFDRVYNIDPISIKYGLPINYPIVSNPFEFKVDLDGFLPNYLGESTMDNKDSDFFLEILWDMWPLYDKRKRPTEQDLLKSIENKFKNLDRIKRYLEQITPIEDVRLSENVNIFKGIKNWTISNLFLEFKIQGYWHPFSNLSDGTKRLFYIISEVIGFSNNEDRSRIILIEEPELGIHPHQLHNLMTFIKEMSKTRQIIITTHSPQVLNVLEADELDQIIIASSKGQEQGTILKHLTQTEKEKAQKYMEDMYLSDYWLYSDLED